MTPLGVLRIPNPEALAFAREKLRACLVAAGLPRVAASQLTAQVSQGLRAGLPAELRVVLSTEGTSLRLETDRSPVRLMELALPRAVARPGDLAKILGQLTREELLHDLERQVEERTADLARERERSESLLANMLPKVIAARMKRGETNIADAQVASVLFADLKGFTVLSSCRPPEEIVVLLDRIFTEFDRLADEHGLEKIKTIGDAYMAAAGLPLPQPDHAARAARMALKMIPALHALRDELRVDLDVRVGVHAGPVVAGVIGKAKFAYDIWGDTVNIASRLESHGAPGRVHISEGLRCALPESFDCEQRGPIEVKGKGMMTTYWLLAER
ncbi:MAG TPA: adenylate/guanylate cyclase domain-containing protein [Polyangiaceae bacterium]